MGSLGNTIRRNAVTLITKELSQKSPQTACELQRSTRLPQPVLTRGIEDAVLGGQACIEDRGEHLVVARRVTVH